MNPVGPKEVDAKDTRGDGRASEGGVADTRTCGHVARLTLGLGSSRKKQRVLIRQMNTWSSEPWKAKTQKNACIAPIRIPTRGASDERIVFQLLLLVQSD